MRWVLRLLGPLADWISGIHLRFGKPKLDAADYVLAIGALRPGDVLLTKESWRPTNLFIKGQTKHSLIFVGSSSGDHDTLVEATYPVARRTSLIEVWQMASRVVLLRPTFADSGCAYDAARYAVTLVGTPYDANFSSGEDALYCSELIDFAYEMTCGSPLGELRETHFGMPGILLPDALRESRFFRVVWDSNEA